MGIHLVLVNGLPCCKGASLLRRPPWDKIRFQDIPGFVYAADLLLAPLMMLGAGGKITHWWDWSPVSPRDIDPAVPPLVVESPAPQQRVYKVSNRLGQYNPEGVRDLYKTLFVLEVVVVLKPESYDGFWRLLVAGNSFQDEKQYERWYRVDVLVKGSVKTLLDGKKHFLGQAEDGRYIALKLVAVTSRDQFPDSPFV